METKTMNNKLALGKIALGLLFASFYTACDESTTENITQVNQVGMDVVSAGKDLPECTAENEGAQAFVKGESSARVCVDEKWIPMTSSVKDTVVLSGDTVYLAGGKDTVYVKDSDLSCKTEPLADSSGLKIICNGDSIGVVLNGAKGDKGDTGEKGDKGDVGDKGNSGENGAGCSVVEQSDTTSLIICDSDTTVLQIDDGKPEQWLGADFSHKCFFLKGTSVYNYELSDGRTLKQTGNVLEREIVRDDGVYKFTAADINTQYSMFVFDGFYNNVVQGKVSAAPIRLKLMTDLRKRSVVNANVLTQLEYDRVYYLVTRDTLTVKKAKRRANYEILNMFHVDTTDYVDAESLLLFGSHETDARLLAITILLLGERTDAEFRGLLTEIADDIAEDGEWNNLEKKKEIATWARDADESGRLDEIRERIVEGTDVELPDFIKYIRNFWQKELSN